jgi:tetratricopeptide (TPR) repeat protein
MATRTMTLERLTSILRPQPTFWNELSDQERQSSVNQAIHRPLGDKTAWDGAGRVSQHWIDEICPVVEEYRRTHSKYILNGKDWTGPVNCFMVGATWMTAVPTVVITSLEKGIYGRFGSLLRKDDRFRRSGFSILGHKGCLRLKMERSHGSSRTWYPTAGGLQHLYGETIVIPYSWSAKAYLEAVHRGDLFGMQDRTTTATMGGVIEIGEQRFGLTVAHPFLDPKEKVAAANTSVVSVESSIILQQKAPDHVSPGTTDIEVFELDALDSYDSDGDPAELADQWDLPALEIDEDLPARPVLLGGALDLHREMMGKSAISALHGYADMQIGTFLGSSIATKEGKSIKGGPGKYADLGLDWALIDLPDDERVDTSNTLIADSVVIRTSHVAKGPPVGDVLVVCKASRYPRAICSGTVALISIPGSGRLQKAYTLKGPQLTAERESISCSGESGSFVIDESTGDAYGVVVAESLDLELTYMIPLDLIFDDIASKWLGDVVRFPQRGQESDHGPWFSLRAKAEEFYRPTRKKRKVLGKVHPDPLPSMNDLAEALSERGRYERAEEMHRQTLGLMETLPGKKPPNALTSINNKANILSYQGKYEQAEEMHRQVLGLRERLLGKKDPDTLTSMNNLAEVLSHQGKYEQAEEMHRQTLGLSETLLGKEHPDTLMSMNNLANVLIHQGKYKQAEEMHQQVLRLREMVLGKKHPDTLTSTYNLANILSYQGKYEQAEEMHRETLGLRETLLGKEHPDTLTSLNNLANILSYQGKYKQAEEMHRQTLGLSETLLGKEHPNTLMSINNLALVLSRQGKYKQAEEMHRQVLGLRETILGKEHPDTLMSINNLAKVLSHQGKYKQAEKMHRQTLRLSETLLGKEHPTTLTSMNSLANVLSHQGKYKQAEEMYQEVLVLRETVLGKVHPDTLTSINNLAYLLSIRKQFSEANTLYRRALNGYGKALAPDHPIVQACQTHYSYMLKEMQEEIEERNTVFKGLR